MKKSSLLLTLLLLINISLTAAESIQNSDADGSKPFQSAGGDNNTSADFGISIIESPDGNTTVYDLDKINFEINSTIVDDEAKYYYNNIMNTPALNKNFESKTLLNELLDEYSASFGVDKNLILTNFHTTASTIQSFIEDEFIYKKFSLDKKQWGKVSVVAEDRKFLEGEDFYILSIRDHLRPESVSIEDFVSYFENNIERWLSYPKKVPLDYERFYDDLTKMSSSFHPKFPFISFSLNAGVSIGELVDIEVKKLLRKEIFPVGDGTFAFSVSQSDYLPVDYFDLRYSDAVYASSFIASETELNLMLKHYEKRKKFMKYPILSKIKMLRPVFQYKGTDMYYQHIRPTDGEVVLSDSFHKSMVDFLKKENLDLGAKTGVRPEFVK